MASWSSVFRDMAMGALVVKKRHPCLPYLLLPTAVQALLLPWQRAALVTGSFSRGTGEKRGRNWEVGWLLVGWWMCGVRTDPQQRGCVLGRCSTADGRAHIGSAVTG